MATKTTAILAVIMSVMIFIVVGKFSLYTKVCNRIYKYHIHFRKNNVLHKIHNKYNFYFIVLKCNRR